MYSGEVIDLGESIQNNDYDDALQRVEEALIDAERDLGESHPDLVEILDVLAKLYEAKGQHGKAKKIYKRALRLWMNAFLPKDSYKYFFADLLPFLFKRKPLQPRFFPKEIIRLSSDLLIHSGSKRDTFVHPRDPRLCIKIDRLWKEGYRVSPRKRLERILMPWLIDFWSNREEARVYRSTALRIGEAFYEHAPRCFGIAMTNLGPGLVVERVCNEDGSFSKPIDVFVKENPDKARHALELLRELYDFLVSHKLVIYDWANPANFLVRQSKSKGDKIIVVDWKTEGTADKDIPLRDIFPALALKKMTYEYSCLYKKISRLCD